MELQKEVTNSRDAWFEICSTLIEGSYIEHKVKTFCNVCCFPISKQNFIMYELQYCCKQISIAFAFSLCLIQHTGSVYAVGPPANNFCQPAEPNLRQRDASVQVLVSRVLKKHTIYSKHTNTDLLHRYIIQVLCLFTQYKLFTHVPTQRYHSQIQIH